MNAAEAILATIPDEARPAPGSPLPDGVEVGHRYSYRLGSRCGSAYANSNGTWTARPNGGGLPDTFLAAHVDRVEHLTHAPYSCRGCGGPAA